MKERPIIFTPENAQKAFEGTKVQTRRILKPQPPEWVKEFGYTCFTPTGSISGRGTYQGQGPAEKFFQCPYGVVGDRLWCREHIWVPPQITERMWRDGADTWPKAMYRGDMDATDIEFCKEHKWKSKPAIHMPRWACRTVVELTEVRVERLKDITPSDALAEGIFCPEVGYAQHGNRAPVLLFGFLWESINGRGSLERNDWVWVLSFKKV